MAFTEITQEEININPFTSWEQVRPCDRRKYREMQYTSRYLGRLRRHVEERKPPPSTSDRAVSPKRFSTARTISPCHSSRRNINRR